MKTGKISGGQKVSFDTMFDFHVELPRKTAHPREQKILVNYNKIVLKYKKNVCSIIYL